MRSAASKEPLAERSPLKVCGGCATAYDRASWCALEPCGAIPSVEARTIVIGWPDSAVVDLRRCAHCGAVLARLS